MAIRSLGWANLLTLLRLLLLMPMLYCIAAQLWVVASLVFVAAVVTDVADGRVARALGEVSIRGGLFDHSVDALFVAVSLGACAWSGLTNPVLAPLILLAFVQYAIDSRAHAGRALRASKLGRYNGIAYYALLGVVLITRALGLEWSLVEGVAGWLLVATTVLSMLDRALAHRIVLDSP